MSNTRSEAGSAPAGNDDNLSQVARGGALTLAGSVVFAAANAAIAFIIARLFDESTAGAFFTAIAIFQILVRVAELGVSTGLVRFLTRYRVHGDMRWFGPVFRGALAPVIVLGVLIGLAMYLGAERAASIVASGDEESVVAGYFRTLAPFLPVAAIYQAVVNGTRGFSTMRPFVMLERLSKPILQVGGILAVGLLDASRELLVVVWAVPILLVAIPTLRWFGSLYSAATNRPQQANPGSSDAEDRAPTEPGARVGEFWRFTGARSLASIAQVSVQFADIPLVAAFVGVREAGIYAVASRYLQVGAFTSLAVSQVMQPKISEAFARKDHVDADRLYKFSTAWLVMLTMPIYLTVTAFALPLLEFFGPEYGEAETALVILSVTTLVASFCGAADTVLIMGGSSVLSFFNLAASAIANITINIVLLKVFGWGIEGAAVAWSVSILLQKFLPASQVIRTLDLNPFGRPGLVTGTIAIATIGTVAVLTRLAVGPTVLGLIVATVVGMAAYAALLNTRRSEVGLDTLVGSFTNRGGR